MAKNIALSAGQRFKPSTLPPESCSGVRLASRMILREHEEDAGQYGNGIAVARCFGERADNCRNCVAVAPCSGLQAVAPCSGLQD